MCCRVGQRPHKNRQPHENNASVRNVWRGGGGEERQLRNEKKNELYHKQWRARRAREKAAGLSSLFSSHSHSTTPVSQQLELGLGPRCTCPCDSDSLLKSNLVVLVVSRVIILGQPTSVRF